MKVPESLRPEVLAFCNRITDEQPRYVEVRADVGAREGDCFPSVAAKVRAEGGAAIHGWAIWEWPGAFLEAEFHAVWRSPAGEVFDILNRAGGDGRVLFLYDPNRTFEGSRVHNRRTPLTRDPLVAKYLVAIGEFELLTGLNVGRVRIRVTPEMRSLADTLWRLQVQMQHRFPNSGFPATLQRSPNDECR